MIHSMIFHGVIWIFLCYLSLKVVISESGQGDHQLQRDRDVIYNASDFIHVMRFTAENKNRFRSQISLVLLKNLDDYYIDIRRICWLEAYLVDTCDQLLQFAQSILEVYKNGFSRRESPWEHYCRVENLSEFDCKNHYSLVYNVPNVITPYEKFLKGYADGFTEIHVNILKDMVSTLLDRECVDKEASRFLASYLQNNFTRKETKKWRHPSIGVFRDVSNAWVPCSPKHWIGSFDGIDSHSQQQVSWAVTPMWSHRYNTETSVARCPVVSSDGNHPRRSDIRELYSASSSSSLDIVSRNNFFSDWNLYCPEILKLEPVNRRASSTTKETSTFACLVVSVISTFNPVASVSLVSKLKYELEMANQFNCKVHVFHSIQEELEETWNVHPNIKLYPVEISMFITNITEYLAPVLDDLRVNPTLRIDVLRLDTSGLDFNVLFVLKDLRLFLGENSERHDPLVNYICNIYLNVQLDGATVYSNWNLQAVADVWNIFTSPDAFHFEIWYLHNYNNAKSYQPPHYVFQAAGFVDGRLVFELGLHQAKCKPAIFHNIDTENQIKGDCCRDNKLEINKIGKSNVTTAEIRRHPLETSGAERTSLIGRQGLRKIPMQAIGDMDHDLFTENYNAIIKLNLTVAIVSFRSHVHTEVVGPLVDLVLSSGISPANIIVYNDLYDFEYSMISVVDGWKSWDIRPVSLCFKEANLWDLLLITTGDDFIHYDKELSLIPFLKLYRNKTITIQHYPHWILPELFPRDLMLTPIVGHQKWIFPIFKIAPEYQYLESSHGTTSSSDEGNRFLLLLGNIMPTPQISSMWNHMNCKYKDISDMHRFLSSNESNTLVAAAIWMDIFDAEIVPHYPSQTLAFRDLTVSELLGVIKMSPYIWIPVTRNSTYLKGVFSSVLSLGFGLRKVFIMPKYLSDFYNFGGAVITYNETILEVDTDGIDRDKVRKQMDIWMYARSIQNSVNFLSCVFGSC